MTGVIGQLVNNSADIAAFPLTLTVGRPTAIDMTYAYYNAGIGILASVSVAPETAFVCAPYLPIVSI
jgi:Ligated ion channel L-glutamate- and glycine-binding site